MHLWRKVPDKESEGVVDRLGFNQMIIIKDKDNFMGNCGQIVDQWRQDSFRWHRLRGLKRGYDFLAKG